MIKLENVSFSYGNEKIISELSAEFEDGRIFCIMGASGVGKTTLMNIISGRLKCTHGIIKGTDNKKSSFIFQENRLLPWYSIYENLKYVTENEEKIIKALNDTGLYDDRNKKVADLSGGMARRVAIARAAAFDGDVFFIDEPLYGLDVKTSQEILSLIKDTVKNKTAFIITHSPEEAFYLADEIIFLRNKPFSSVELVSKGIFTDADGIKSHLLA